MKTKPIYKEFFTDTKGTLGYTDITHESKSIRRRMFTFFAMLLVVILLFMGLFSKYNGGNISSLIILPFFCAALLISIYHVWRELDRKNLNDLLKVHGKLYHFAQKELNRISALIDRIRYERLKVYFKKNISDADYIASLAADAKDYAEKTKVVMNKAGFGINTIIQIITPIYLSALFNLWKTDTTVQITLKTVIIVFISIVFCFLIHILKDFHLYIANYTHRRHQQNHEILKELERRVRFK